MHHLHVLNMQEGTTFMLLTKAAAGRRNSQQACIHIGENAKEKVHIYAQLRGRSRREESATSEEERVVMMRKGSLKRVPSARSGVRGSGDERAASMRQRGRLQVYRSPDVASSLVARRRNATQPRTDINVPRHTTRQTATANANAAGLNMYAPARYPQR